MPLNLEPPTNDLFGRQTADHINVDLRGENLSGANFNGANLSEADLVAQLRIGCPNAPLTASVSNSATAM